jgi:hypothetical protein
VTIPKCNSSSAHIANCSSHVFTHSYYYQINFSYSVNLVSYKLLRLDNKLRLACLCVFMMKTTLDPTLHNENKIFKLLLTSSIQYRISSHEIRGFREFTCHAAAAWYFHPYEACLVCIFQWHFYTLAFISPY